jgi:hypothetical protein
MLNCPKVKKISPIKSNMASFHIFFFISPLGAFVEAELLLSRELLKGVNLTKTIPKNLAAIVNRDDLSIEN